MYCAHAPYDCAFHRPDRQHWCERCLNQIVNVPLPRHGTYAASVVNSAQFSHTFIHPAVLTHGPFVHHPQLPVYPPVCQPPVCQPPVCPPPNHRK